MEILGNGFVETHIRGKAQANEREHMKALISFAVLQ
jgi:hypothetical protein